MPADRRHPRNKVISLAAALVALAALVPFVAGHDLDQGWTAAMRLVLVLDMVVIARWGYWRNR